MTNERLGFIIKQSYIDDIIEKPSLLELRQSAFNPILDAVEAEYNYVCLFIKMCINNNDRKHRLSYTEGYRIIRPIIAKYNNPDDKRNCSNLLRLCKAGILSFIKSNVGEKNDA